MLKCPLGDGMKHYYAHVRRLCALCVGLFLVNPHKHRPHRHADVEDKVLHFLFCSDVGHIKWPARLVVCANTQYSSHKSFGILIETKHKWASGSKFLQRGGIFFFPFAPPMLSLLGDQFIVQANNLFPFFLLFRPGTVNRYCTAVLTYIVNYRLRRRDSFTAHEVAGVSILCWADLFLTLYWLDCRVKVDRDCCFGSRAGSRSHSHLECCLVRYSLNSHAGRWIALPQFFFSSVPDCSGNPPPPNIPRWEKTERSDMFPCVEAYVPFFHHPLLI